MSHQPYDVYQGAKASYLMPHATFALKPEGDAHEVKAWNMHSPAFGAPPAWLEQWQPSSQLLATVEPGRRHQQGRRFHPSQGSHK